MFATSGQGVFLYCATESRRSSTSFSRHPRGMMSQCLLLLGSSRQRHLLAKLVFQGKSIGQAVMLHLLVSAFFYFFMSMRAWWAGAQETWRRCQ